MDQHTNSLQQSKIVIKKNINKKEFERFLQEQNLNQSELNEETQKELMDEFLCSIILNKNGELNKSKIDLITEQNAESPKKIEQIYLKPDFPIDLQHKIQQVLESEKLISEKLEINIIEGSKEKGFFGFGGEILYFHITSKPNGVSVKRSSRDFANFRQTLSNQYQEKIIPFIPQIKKIEKKGNDDKIFLAKLIKDYERFINLILQEEEFLCFPLFESFLLQQDYKLWEKELKKFSQLPKAKTIQQSKTSVDQEINLSIDNKLIIDINKLEEFIYNRLSLFWNIKDSFKQTFYNFGEVQGQLNTISDHIMQMQTQYENDPVKSFKTQLSNFGQTMIIWEKQVNEQEKNFNQIIKQYLREIKYNLLEFEELKKNVEDALNQLYSEYKKKNNFLMDEERFQNYKDFYCFLLQNFKIAAYKKLNLMEKNLVQANKEFAQLQKQSMQKFMDQYAQILDNDITQ